MNNENRVCPVERAGALDNKIRRWLQNPVKILKPYIKEGMTVIDVGCGPGFFTLPLAELVGENGKVIAADLQDGMLRTVHQKIKGTELEKRIKLHKCDQDKIGITEKVDFIFAFYMVHEVPGKENFLRELKSLIKEDGMIFIIEPKFHVSKKAFGEMLEKIKSFGLKPIESPKIFLSHTVLLKS